MQEVYRYDLSKLVRRLTPPRWRNAFNLHWYETLLSPINYSQDRFNDYKDQALIELSYNGQTIVLESMLNNKFDSLQRRIIIKHEEDNSVFWYLEDEGQAPNYLYVEGETGTTSTYLYNEGENSTGLPEGIDFRVIAPLSLSSKEPQIRAEINKYKLAGKVYDIEFV
jgi:hypothetical protein